MALCVCCAHTKASAQEIDQGAADTSSPRATLRSYIDACNEISRAISTQTYLDRDDVQYQPVVDRVLDCMDDRELPAFAREEAAAESAICIKEILDRYELPAWDDIPDLAAIEAAGGFENLSRWRVPGTRITIARVEEGPQKHEYLFSPGTVNRSVEYFKRAETRAYRTTGPQTSPGFYKWYVSVPGHQAIGRIVEKLPDRMRFGRTLGMANWKWPGLLILSLIAIALLLLIYRIHFFFVGRTCGKSTLGYCLTLIFPVTAMCVPLAFLYFADQWLTLRGTPLYIVGFVSYAIAVLGAVVVVFVACNRIAEAIIASPRINPRGLNAQLIRIASKLISVVLAVVVLLVGGQFLGVPVATLLASAGIGGIALALGAQDTLKNLFGTIMLMADKPFRVGERIVFQTYDGVVEDIGLRSTRIRLLNGHQVTVPNDQLAASDIENVGRRAHIRRSADIHIPLDTPRDKVEEAVEIVRRHLDDHEGMHADFPPRVFFFDFFPTAFTIRMIYWYHPAEYWKFLEFSEKVNFAIFRDFEEQGIQFSLPQRFAPTSIDGAQAPIEVQLPEQSHVT